MIGRSRSTLWWASVAHFLNDGLAAALTPLLPLMAADLALSYTQAGAVKAALNGVTSLSQLPAGFLATRASEATFLGLGLGWFSLSYLLMGLAGGYLALLLLMASAGIGGGVYHPVGTAWVSHTFLAGRRGAAVGTLNFAGDVGKVALPALAGVLIAWIGWRGSLSVLGAAGAVTAVALVRRDWLGRGGARAARRRPWAGWWPSPSLGEPSASSAVDC
jgi:MFS family permease